MPLIPTPAFGPTRLTRATQGRLIAGVARGLATHLRVNVLVVRLAFIALTAAAGAGLAIYAAFWVFVPPQPSGPADGRRLDGRTQYVAIAALTIGGVLAVQSLGLGLPGELLWPLALTGFGAAVLWRQADEAQRASWRNAATGKDGKSAPITSLAGAALVIAGVATFLIYQGQLGQVRNGLLASVVIIAGVAVITGPWWLGTLRELAAERRARIREQERAELAAHLHDSVLHTLALIQRHVDDPREVQRLVRGQERELRSWLYKPAADHTQDFGGALEQAVADVEDAHRVTIETVVVGERKLDEGLFAMLQAAREAMINAAKHTGGAAISVYAELDAAKATVFIRDRGQGFDATAVPGDRLGVKESIVGRMERHGGKATIRSSPGFGTEIQLEMATAMARS